MDKYSNLCILYIYMCVCLMLIINNAFTSLVYLWFKVHVRLWPVEASWALWCSRPFVPDRWYLDLPQGVLWPPQLASRSVRTWGRSEGAFGLDAWCRPRCASRSWVTDLEACLYLEMIHLWRRLCQTSSWILSATVRKKTCSDQYPA